MLQTRGSREGRAQGEELSDGFRSFSRPSIKERGKYEKIVLKTREFGKETKPWEKREKETGRKHGLFRVNSVSRNKIDGD